MNMQSLGNWITTWTEYGLHQELSLQLIFYSPVYLICNLSAHKMFAFIGCSTSSGALPASPPVSLPSHSQPLLQEVFWARGPTSPLPVCLGALFKPWGEAFFVFVLRMALLDRVLFYVTGSFPLVLPFVLNPGWTGDLHGSSVTSCS